MAQQIGNKLFLTHLWQHSDLQNQVIVWHEDGFQLGDWPSASLEGIHHKGPPGQVSGCLLTQSSLGLGWNLSHFLSPLTVQSEKTQTQMLSRTMANFHGWP